MFRFTTLAAMALLAWVGAAAAQIQYYSPYAGGGQYGTITGGEQTSAGYTPYVISLRKPQRPILKGETGPKFPAAETSPYIPPSFASDFQNRIRVVDSDGNFRNRYNGTNGRYLGTNWHGPQSVQDMAINDHNKSMRRQSWGVGSGKPYRPQLSSSGRSSGYSAPSRQPAAAPRRSSSGSSSFANAQRQFNAIKAQSDARISAINNRSASFRSASTQNLNNYGAQLRNSMSGSRSSGGGSGGGARVYYDDNAPGKGRR